MGGWVGGWPLFVVRAANHQPDLSFKPQREFCQLAYCGTLPAVLTGVLQQSRQHDKGYEHAIKASKATEKRRKEQAAEVDKEQQRAAAVAELWQQRAAAAAEVLAKRVQGAGDSRVS